ncbi:MAG: glycine oxidase ThiO [Vicinamibacterales bacterium]
MSRPSDIIVVGAGVVGCAIAYELSRRGASVEILDDRQAGMGATQASAGILAPYIEAEEGSPLLPLTVRSLGLFETFVQCAASASGLEVAFRRTGTLDVALTPSAMARFERLAGWLRDQGVSSDLLDAQGVKAQEPLLTDRIAGGLVIPIHGYVAAHDLTRALAAAARRHGARVLEQGRVRRISQTGPDTVVTTDRGPLVADAVVLAGGSWSGQIEIEGVQTALPVRPVRGQLLHLAWSGSPLKRVTWADHLYMVPWDDGTLLVGATMEEAGFDERTTAAGVHDLLNAACALVPQARNAAFLSARAGLRPATPDAVPVIGRSLRMPTVTYATGHFRNGVLLAPLTAQLVADLILDDKLDPALEWTSPARFGDL